jgi:hypothetical protein
LAQPDSPTALDSAEQPTQAPHPTWQKYVTADPPWHKYLTAHDPDDSEQLEIEVIAPPRRALTGRGRFENNLSRKAIFEMRTDREAERSGTVTRTDLVGKTTLTFTLGALGPMEMDVIAWTMGQWQRGYEYVSFSLRELSRALGMSYYGGLAKDMKEALRRIKATTISGRVWDAKERKHTTTHFSIFDVVHIAERRRSEDGPATEPATVTVKLSTWILDQLHAGQYSDFDWEGYRGKLKTPLARRLYLLLEGHQGEQDGTFLRLAINSQLGDTLGTEDAVRNPSRFRARLVAAGNEICSTRSQYESISVKSGTRKREYVLEVRRSFSWAEEKLRTRRRLLASVS